MKQYTFKNTSDNKYIIERTFTVVANNYEQAVSRIKNFEQVKEYKLISEGNEIKRSDFHNKKDKVDAANRAQWSRWAKDQVYTRPSAGKRKTHIK